MGGEVRAFKFASGEMVKDPFQREGYVDKIIIFVGGMLYELCYLNEGSYEYKSWTEAELVSANKEATQ